MACKVFMPRALLAFFLLLCTQLLGCTCSAASVSAIPAVEQEVIRELSYGWPESEDVNSLQTCSTYRYGITPHRGIQLLLPMILFIVPIDADNTASTQTLPFDRYGYSGQFQIFEPAGIRRLITFFDSSDANDGWGRNGGWSYVYSIQPGSANCLSIKITPLISITTSVNYARMCNVVEIDIAGGVGPYTVMVVPLQVRSTWTRIILPPGHSRLNYVNQNSPAEQIVFVVRDSLGTLSKASQILTTYEEETTCSEHSTSSFGPATLDPPDADDRPRNKNNGDSSLTKPQIIGISIGSTLALLLFLVGLWFYIQRRLREKRFNEEGPAWSPTVPAPTNT